MKKKLRIVLAAVLVAAGLAVTAGAASFESSADKLKDIGLFQGTGSGYELDRAPTRAEAATMLVRLLGKEAEAKELEYSAPFTDLDNWQKPYVQYLYDNKLTNGATATTFEPEDTCTAQMYTTFLLRALGYSDGADGDFTYSGALAYGEEISLVDAANCNQTRFLRDHVAAMSLTALNTQVKGSETALLDKLVADGAIEAAKAESLQAFFADYDEYVAASAALSDETKMDMSADVGANVKVNGEQLMELSMPMTMKADMNLEDMDKSVMAMTATVALKAAAEVTGQQQPDSAEIPMEMYYTDGKFYMNMMDQKVYMPLSFNDAIDQMGGLTSSVQQTEPVCLIESIEHANGGLVVTYSGSGLKSMVDSVLDSMGLMPEGVSFKMGDVDTTVTVAGGRLTEMKMGMQLSVEVMGESMDMDMDMSFRINAVGDSVTITLPTDLDTYQEMSASTLD